MSQNFQHVQGRHPQSRSRVMSYTVGSPVVGTSDAVLEATSSLDSGPTEITSFDGQPDVARNVTATSGGTAGDIAGVVVTVAGTNIHGESISEDLPTFTADSGTTVEGDKAFATVTSVTVPSMDGAGATVEVGLGGHGSTDAHLGFPVKLDRNTVIAAFHGGTKEGTAPTVAFSSSNVEDNTVELDTALDGSEVLIDYYT